MVAFSAPMARARRPTSISPAPRVRTSRTHHRLAVPRDGARLATVSFTVATWSRRMAAHGRLMSRRASSSPSAPWRWCAPTARRRPRRAAPEALLHLAQLARDVGGGGAGLQPQRSSSPHFARDAAHAGHRADAAYAEHALGDLLSTNQLRASSSRAGGWCRSGSACRQLDLGHRGRAGHRAGRSARATASRMSSSAFHRIASQAELHGHRGVAVLHLGVDVLTFCRWRWSSPACARPRSPSAPATRPAAAR